MFIIPSYCIAVALANIFQCKPVKAGWDFFLHGDCLPLQEITVATGALNIVTDVLLVVAPILLVSRLQLHRARMIGLLFVLATGFLYRAYLLFTIEPYADQL